MHGLIRNIHKIFTGKPEGRRPQGRSRHRPKDNIKQILWKEGRTVLTGSIWLRMGICGELFIRIFCQFQQPIAIFCSILVYHLLLNNVYS
jgi:hypothetical protein